MRAQKSFPNLIMDELAANETNKPYIYKVLKNAGTILPNFTSSAVTVESLLRVNDNQYHFPNNNEVAHLIRSPRTLNAPIEMVHEILKIYVRSCFNKLMPFDNCPDSDYLLTILHVVDPTNKLELMTDVYNLNEMVHSITRDGQTVDFVEPSKKNRLQKLYDGALNKVAKFKNFAIYYNCELAKAQSNIVELRKNAECALSQKTPLEKEFVMKNPKFVQIFSDEQVNVPFLLTGDHYLPEQKDLSLFDENNYSDFAKALLVKLDINAPDKREMAQNVKDLPSLNLFMSTLPTEALHKDDASRNDRESDRASAQSAAIRMQRDDFGGLEDTPDEQEVSEVDVSGGEDPIKHFEEAEESEEGAMDVEQLESEYTVRKEGETEAKNVDPSESDAEGIPRGELAMEHILQGTVPHTEQKNLTEVSSESRKLREGLQDMQIEEPEKKP